MKWIKYILIALLAIVILVGASIFWVYQSHQTDYTGDKQIVGLSSEVDVIYDDYGIPHISADNTQDAFRALGYIHAKDRLFQMDVLRRIGSGKLAEFFGKDLLKTDRFFRTIGTKKHAEESVSKWMIKHPQKPYMQLSQAYIDGINQFIEEEHFPLEYLFLGSTPEKFTVTDLYYTVSYMSYSFAIALQEDPMANYIQSELGADYVNSLGLHHDSTWHTLKNTFASDTSLVGEIQNIVSSLPAAPFLGSNSWVLSPQKSKSGKVLFCNDTHIGFAQPSVWYEAHIESPELSLYGNFLAGFPFPLVGHTNRHAWGLTMFQNDDMDLYAEEIEGNRVKYNNEWTDIQYRKDTIFVKDGEPEIITIRETPHGPIINDASEIVGKSKQQTSVYWTFTKFPIEAAYVAYGFSFSKNIEEFKSYLPHLAAPGLNVMYGDADDNIAWWATAKMIKRPDHVNSKLILDGASGNDEPIGWYDFENNPHAVNPEWGYVHSANNQPEKLAVDSIYYPGYYYPGARSLAIAQALEAKEQFDVEDMKNLLMANTSPIYPENAQFITQDVEPNNSLEEFALSALQNWDGNHSLEATEPALYYALNYQVIKLSMSDELSPFYFNTFLNSHLRLRSFYKFIRSENSPWWDDQNTENKETRKDIFQAAFQAAVIQVSESMGDDPAKWNWKNVHQVTHEHPLGKVKPLDKLFNVGPYSVASGEEVINKLPAPLSDSCYYPVKSGPAMRIIIDFADIDHAWSINPTGQSGNPFSPFYKDQAEMYVNGGFRHMWMDLDSVENRTFARQKLTVVD